MRKIVIAAYGMALLAAGPLHAADAIAVEKLPPDKVAQTIRAASADTVIEINGRSKTKAQWSSYFQSMFKLLDSATLKAMDNRAKAKAAADAKTLQDNQDAAIAQQNAQTAKEFEALSAQ
jgi:hypothetical protein